jgi:hypothetical protein
MAVVVVSLAYRVLSPDVAAQALTVRAPVPVKEEMFVRIGGIDQWIHHQGK